MIRGLFLLAALSVLFHLSGCGTVPPRGRPAPVVRGGTAVPAPAIPPARAMEPVPVPAAGAPATAPGQEAAPVEERGGYEPAAAALPPPAAGNPAVQALQADARRLQRQGDLAGAAASLERALRIEPRNPHLWNRLAHIRLQQGHWTQAAQLAARSNALAGDDPGLRADNRRIIARAAASR